MPSHPAKRKRRKVRVVKVEASQDRDKFIKGLQMGSGFISLSEKKKKKKKSR